MFNDRQEQLIVVKDGYITSGDDDVPHDGC